MKDFHLYPNEVVHVHWLCSIAQTHAYSHILIYIYRHTHTRICTHTHTHTHTYTYMYTHTHTHTEAYRVIRDKANRYTSIHGNQTHTGFTKYTEMVIYLEASGVYPTVSTVSQLVT